MTSKSFQIGSSRLLLIHPCRYGGSAFKKTRTYLALDASKQRNQMRYSISKRHPSRIREPLEICRAILDTQRLGPKKLENILTEEV